MTVRPVRAKSRKLETTDSAIEESKPLVGSSTKRSEGLSMISLPMATLFLSPPDIPRVNPGAPTRVFSQFFKLSSLITSSTRACFCS
jgi:hypothetical protein